MGLEPDASVDWEALDALALEAQSAPAMDDAARYLSFAERTEKKLSQYLERRGYETRVIERTVVRSVELGWVDDARFARAFVSSRPDMGRSRLLQELRKRGVPENESAGAIAGRSDRETASGLAPLVRRRYGALPREVALRRAVGFLVRRGIPGPEAFRAVREILGSGGRSDEES